jgi:signal transduction histidine kinase
MVGALILAAAITVVMASGHQSAWAARHLYLLPVGALAIRRGMIPAAGLGAVAGLLQAPLLFPLIEREGLSVRALDGCISMVLPLVCGVAIGTTADLSRRRAARLRALLSVQAILSARAAPVEDSLAVVVSELRRALGVSRAAVILGGGASPPVTATDPRGPGLHPGSAAAWALSAGVRVELADVDTDRRIEPALSPSATPVRGLIVPLIAGEDRVGVLVIESEGDLSRAARAAAGELAVHLALVLENARLGLLQRRFAEELEQQVAAATRSLRELDRAKTEFLSVVSHELRTPLTALQGFTELLLGRTVEPDRAHRWIAYMHDEARRLGRIVSDLLDLARIEAAGSADLRREPVDLNALVRRNLELFAAAHPGHSFLGGGEAGSPVVIRADADAIDRVLKNLLSNAVKYSPGGGAVEVNLGPSGEHTGMMELAVRDEGLGIPEAAQAAIFDKYVRVANPGAAGVRGLGLGLALVRTLVEAHGGRVRVESRSGRGSRFVVLLPA